MKIKIEYSDRPDDPEHQDRIKGLTEALGPKCTVKGYTWGIEVEGEDLSRNYLVDRVRFGRIGRLEEVA